MIKITKKSEVIIVSLVACVAILIMFSQVASFSGVGEAIKAASLGMTKATCSETDGGDVSSVKGSASVKQNSIVSTTKTDYCPSTEALTEYYCNDRSIIEKSYDCLCEEGVCVGYQKADTGPTVTPSSATTQFSTQQTAQAQSRGSTMQMIQTNLNVCQDSDGSLSEDDRYKTAGTASVSGSSSADSCTSNDGLKEVYCSSNQVKTTTISCAGALGSSYFCANGACVNTCQDNDATKSQSDMYRYEGTVTVKGSSTTDSCVDSDSLTEMGCSGASATSTQISCSGFFGNSYICYQGKCKSY